MDVAAGYAHPCMVVQVTSATDVGGQLGDRVYLYNNIAQHNISFATMAQFAAETYVLPFAVGHAGMPARMTELRFNLFKAEGAIVRIDTRPDPTLPFVERILRDGRGSHDEGCCVVELLGDARFLVHCGDQVAEVDLRKGSRIRTRSQTGGSIGVEELEVRGGIATDKAGVFELNGSEASIAFPLAADQVVPMAVSIEPLDAGAGRTYRVDVTQVSAGEPRGGVTLEVRP